MKDLKVSIAIILTFLFASVNVIQVKAEYVVGIKSGDWTKYDVTLGGNVNPITHDYWTKITVHNVSGTVISGIFEEKSPSGLSSQGFSINITKGHSSNVLKDYYIIPANLTTGSAIPALNLTVMGTIARNGREAVYTLVEGGSQQQGFWNISYCWDKSTGVLLDYDPGGTVIEIISTNLWGDQTDWTFWALIIIAIVIAVSISLGFFIRHRRHLKRVAESYVYGSPPTPDPESSSNLHR